MQREIPLWTLILLISNSWSSIEQHRAASSSIEQQYKMTPKEIQNSIIQGFDMAVQAGPLCLEQMMGVIYIVEDINVVEDVRSAAFADGDEDPPKKESE